MKIVFASLMAMLLLATGANALSWSGASASPQSGVQYAPGAKYGLQIAWDAGDKSVSNVQFESNFSTPDGSLANATASNSSNIYFVNFTGLPAGNYIYRWYAVDNESNWNSTDQDVYEVSRNSSVTIHLYLNGTENNRSYDINSAANLTAFLNLPGRTVYLSSTYPGFATQSGTSSAQNLINLTSQGLFSATAYWDGDANYSPSTKTLYFDDTPPQYSEMTENPPGQANYVPGRTYAFNIKWTGANLNKVLFESNLTGAFRNYSISTSPKVQNSSSYFFIAFTDLPAELFAYRWIAINSLGTASSTNEVYYYVGRANPLSLEVIPSSSVIQGTETAVRCISTTGEVPLSKFNLYRNSVLIGNDTLYSRKDQQILNASTYVYVCNTSGSQNFTNQSVNATLTVNLSVNFTPALTVDGPSSLSMNPGQNASLSFYLNNNLGFALSKLFASLDGIDSSWYSIADLPASIPDNFSMLIRINLNIPSGANQGVYIFNLRSGGTSPSNVTTVANKSLPLSITIPQPQNLPPISSLDTANATVSGNLYQFALKWTDDAGLSGYIFSSNITGEWVNDSWTPLPGTEGFSYAQENISVATGAVTDWKFYANDTNNVWSESEEFSLAPPAKGFDFIPFVMVAVFIAGLAAFIFFISEKKARKAPKKEDVNYVYSKKDL